MYIIDIIAFDDLPAECIADCSTPGQDASESVAFWRKRLKLTVNRVNAIKCLRGYGAWDEDELVVKDGDELADWILWLACGDFRSGDSDIFTLE